MEDKNSNFEGEEQEALELLESIKKAHDQEKKLLKDNTFVYFYLWSGLTHPPTSPASTTQRRVKIYPFPAKEKQ
ncbi:MAG: hypothetical protein HS126_20885 [Anaerolineales bacterium]|nr:hypothetical protein [Anaerolineales bacterium]